MRLIKLSLFSFAGMSLFFSQLLMADEVSVKGIQSIELPCLFVEYGEQNKLAAITLKMKQTADSNWDISEYNILGEVDDKNNIIGKDGNVIEGKCSQYIRPEIAMTY